jgi:vancomycin resistance protein YoaR
VRRSICRLSKKWAKKIIAGALLPTAVILGGLVIYCLAYSGKIYPTIKIADIEIGGQSLKNASLILSSKISPPEKIHLVGQGQFFDIQTKDIELSYNFAESSQRVYNYTRTGNLWYDLSNRIELLIHPKNFGLIINLNNDKLAKIVSVISGQVSVEAVDPSIKLTNGKIEIQKGSAGYGVDQGALKVKIGEALSFQKTEEVKIPITIIDHSLNDDQAKNLQVRAEKYVGKSIQVKFEYSIFALNDSDLIKLLDPKSGYKDGAIDEMVQDLAKKTNRDPQNPKFNFLPAQAGGGGRVSQFQPALDGIKLDEENLKAQLTTSLSQLENSDDKVLTFDIPVVRTPPGISTDKSNSLGINELIGRGTSTYYHSITSRIHNISLAASRINGILVKPGEIFSFNNALGDISEFTGYQQAYIISEGKTILGDGGGVCQVSTTLFRAILNAGLPVLERQAHAYRVGYYEQGSPPGLDATVYSPSPDLKFKNDTPAYILIQAKANPKNYSLVFELYGTSDGRVATVSKPVVTDIVTPPEDLYQDDPTLPAGTIKQIDFKAWGAKVTFNYIVKRGGQEIYSKKFTSNYRPWQSVYLRGTGPSN